MLTPSLCFVLAFGLWPCGSPLRGRARDRYIEEDALRERERGRQADRQKGYVRVFFFVLLCLLSWMARGVLDFLFNSLQGHRDLTHLIVAMSRSSMWSFFLLCSLFEGR